MAKTKRKHTRKKKRKNKSSKFKYYFMFVLLIGFFAAAYWYKNELKRVYHKLRITYLREERRQPSISEQEKINNIVHLYKDHVFGIDISHYQSFINWEQITFLEDSIPIDFIIIRATAGKNKADNYFTYNWEEAKKKNVIRGAYHYYRPNENSTEQANNFINKVKLEKGDFAPVLDIEQAPYTQTMASLRTGLQNWLNLVEAHYGVKPIIYTGDSFYNDYLKGKGFEDYSIWIANYNRSISKPRVKDWIIWQFSEQGSVKGIEGFVDINVFNGNDTLLNTFLIE